MGRKCATSEPKLQIRMKDSEAHGDRSSYWYNAVCDLPVLPPAPLDSDRGHETVRLQQLIPKQLLYLSTSKKRLHPIPQDVVQKYRDFNRPTPLVRAKRLEDYLGTKSRIYFKREDLLPPGSFKMNSAIAQVSCAHAEGFTGVVTETGAGQWGLAVSIACAIYGISCRIYMPRCSYEQKAIRTRLMTLHGAEVLPSPSCMTLPGLEQLGNERLIEGSIGTAISEAVAFATRNPGCAYLAGGNMPYVQIHQSIIGLETADQLQAISEVPTHAIACVGGGSNFAGFVLPLVYGPKAFAPPPVMFACESSVAPRLTQGEYRYDHSDMAGLTPLVKSFTLGRSFVFPTTHIAGLRQHSGSPTIGVLHAQGLLEVAAYDEHAAVAAGRLIAELEGILPAPETSHALCGALEAARASRTVQSVIVVCISGSGELDMDWYGGAK
jgi:tryptophan synthase beta chain